MRKKVQEVIGQTIRQSFLDYAWSLVKIGAVLLLLLFLYGNISLSQSVTPLYFTLFDNEKATVRFLQSIQSLPEFTSYFRMAKNIFGSQIEQKVYQESRDRKQMIGKLEALLRRSPKARDALYNLSVLYKAEGDEERSQNYLERAREVDPLIGS